MGIFAASGRDGRAGRKRKIKAKPVKLEGVLAGMIRKYSPQWIAGQRKIWRV